MVERPPAMNGPNFEPMVHGLRGVAALSVYLFHVWDMMRKQQVLAEESFSSLEQAAIVGLSGGVDIFFMISGYLITGSLIRHANIRSFLVDRVTRLYPLFLFLHVLLFAAAPMLHYKWTVGLTGWEWAFHFTTNLLMLPGIFDLPLMQLNAWSLSYEWCFYLVSAAICAAFLARRGVVTWTALGIGVTLLLFIYPRGIFFAAGALAYFANARRKAIPAFVQNAAVAIAAPVAFLLLMGESIRLGSAALTYAAFLPGLALFLLASRGEFAYGGILGSRPLQFLGTISYSFYLWHPVVTYPLKLLAARIAKDVQVPATVTVLVFGITGFCLTVAVSYPSFLILEKRATKWLRTWLERPRRVAVRAA